MNGTEIDDGAIPGGVDKYPIWLQAADDLVREFSYGDTVPHEWLDEHLGIEYPETGTRETMQAISLQKLTCTEELKIILREEHLILLRNVRGVGYELVHPNAQTEAVMEDYRDALDRVGKKTVHGLVYINHSLLTAQESQKNAEALAKVNWMRSSQRNSFSGRKRKLSGREQKSIPHGGEEGD